jgi:hypothetical protein
MIPPDTRPTADDVLSAFAVEADHNRPTLERYLRDYPQYAAELVDLSQALACDLPVSTAPLSGEDQSLIDAAWERHIGRVSDPGDPFVSLTLVQWRAAASHLNLPRQIMAAFRERRVIVTSVPGPILERLAAVMNTTVDWWRDALARPPMLVPELRRYKADTQPAVDSQVTFERLLADAQITPERRASLLAGEG